MSTLLLRRCYSPHDEADAHGCCSCDEQRAAPKAVDEESAGYGYDERHHRKAAVEAELHVFIRDTDTVVDIGRVVGDQAISGPLREES
jgi:hypothetical protein